MMYLPPDVSTQCSIGAGLAAAILSCEYCSLEAKGQTQPPPRMKARSVADVTKFFARAKIQGLYGTATEKPGVTGAVDSGVESSGGVFVTDGLGDDREDASLADFHPTMGYSIAIYECDGEGEDVTNQARE